MHTAQKEVRPHQRFYVSGAQDQSRDELLLLATNRYSDADSQSRLSLDQFKEAFYLLIDDVGMGTKQIIARTLSRCITTPRPIALYLALEPLSISTPILEHSSALGQLDMLQIVDLKGADYAAIIATRSDIGPSVSRRLSEYTKSKAQLILNNNDVLTDKNNSRSADTLFQKIEAETPERRHKVAVSSGQKQAAERLPIENSLLKSAARGGRLNTKSASRAGFRLNDIDFAESLEKVARARSHQAMAVLIQKRFNISLDAAYQVLEDDSGDTLAVVMRAADVDYSRANRIQLLAHPSIGLSVQNAMRAIRFYSKLKPASCQCAIDQWPKAASDMSSALHQPQLQDGRFVRDRSDRVVPSTGEITRNMERLAG